MNGWRRASRFFLPASRFAVGGQRGGSGAVGRKETLRPANHGDGPHPVDHILVPDADVPGVVFAQFEQEGLTYFQVNRLALIIQGDRNFTAVSSIRGSQPGRWWALG